MSVISCVAGSLNHLTLHDHIANNSLKGSELGCAPTFKQAFAADKDNLEVGLFSGHMS